MINTVKSIHGSLLEVIDFFQASDHVDHYERSWQTYGTALATLAYDVGEVAIIVASTTESLRTSRLLSDTLLHYSLRAHYVVRYPESSESLFASFRDAVRRIAEYGVLAGAFEASFAEHFYGNTVPSPQPAKEDMMLALIANIVPDVSLHHQYYRRLKAESSFAYSYIHGDAEALADLFTGSPRQLNLRGSILSPEAEVLRCGTTLLSLLAAMELKLKRSFSVESHLNLLRSLLPFGIRQSLGSQDVLRSVFKLE